MRVLVRVDDDLERESIGGAGDWPYMRAVSEIGMLAVQTGLAGNVHTEYRMPGPCSIVEVGDTGVYLACERAVWWRI